MRQYKIREQRPRGHRAAGTDAPIKAASWRSRLGMLACAAALCQGPAAMAAGLLVDTPSTGTWVATLWVDAQGLPLIYDAESSNLLDPRMQSGVVTANAAHLEWEVQTDQAPGGGGSLRSVGHMDTTQSMVYTLESNTETQARVQTSGLNQTTGQWTFYDASGNLFTDARAHASTVGDLSLFMRLSGPADLRLSGLLWSTAASGSFSALLEYDQDGDTPSTELLARSAIGDLEALEYQWRLPGPGVIYLNMADHTRQLMPCCDIAFSGSSGWELTIEASALAAVPEPASAGLMLVGVAALGWRRRALAKHSAAAERQP